MENCQAPTYFTGNLLLRCSVLTALVWIYHIVEEFMTYKLSQRTRMKLVRDLPDGPYFWTLIGVNDESNIAPAPLPLFPCLSVGMMGIP